jgi:GNAT superfamily N-acetyltransferase
MSISLFNDCSFGSLSENIEQLNLKDFDCNNEDLNEFFKQDALKYSKDLLGKTYVFVLDESKDTIVCMFTVSNDSLKADDLPNSRKKKVNKEIPRNKQRKSYPAVLIGRLGVASKFIGSGIGTQLMDFIKAWFIDPLNKTGCRFVVVDAYNTENAINYYLKNDFEFLFSSENQEKEYIGKEESDDLKTRMMYFDLLSLNA